MNNPWKSRSQINPQREDGNRQISNEVYRALIKAPLTIGEIKVALCIIDKTWGFGKSTDIISIGQISSATNLGDRGIRKILISLKEMRLIHYQESKVRVNRGSAMNEFLFNKHHDTWVFKGGTVVQGLNGSVDLSLNGGSATKETITKERKSESKIKKSPKKKKAPKKTFLCDSSEYTLADFFYKEILKNNPEHAEPNMQTWASTFDLMIRKNKRDPRAIAELIRWVQADNIPDIKGFCWAINCLSPTSLRKNFDMLTMKKKAKETQFKGTEDKRSYHKPLEDLEEV